MEQPTALPSVPIMAENVNSVPMLSMDEPQQQQTNNNIGPWMMTFIHISFEAIIICSLAIYFFRKQNQQQDEISKLKQELSGVKESVRTLTEEMNQIKRVLSAHLSGAPIESAAVPVAVPVAVPAAVPVAVPAAVPAAVPVAVPVVKAVIEEDTEFSLEDIENQLFEELNIAQEQVDNIRSANSTPKKD